MMLTRSQFTKFAVAALSFTVMISFSQPDFQWLNYILGAVFIISLVLLFTDVKEIPGRIKRLDAVKGSIAAILVIVLITSSVSRVFNGIASAVAGVLLTLVFGAKMYQGE